MRILFVHEVSYLGKVVFEMHDFPELLAGAGHEVHFVDFPEGVAPRGLRRLLDLRTTTTRGVNRSHQGGAVTVHTPGRGLPPPFDRPVARLIHPRVITRIIRDHGIDLMVLYGVPTNGPQAIAAAHRAGVPVLFRAIDVSHLLRVTRLSPLIRRAERRVYRSADWVSTHNGALRDYCISEGADPERTSIEYPGVDLERFAPAADRGAARARLGYGPDDRIVLFMGTLYRFAGLDGLIDDLAPRLAAPGGPKLLIVGDGEAREGLERQVGQRHLGDAVRFTGRVDYDRLPEVLSVADVAVNPFAPSPLTHCALPGKILQYMACGLATVTTPLDGLRSAVGDGSGVRFAPQGRAFADAVLDLVDDPEAAARDGRRARAVMERDFRWEGCLGRFADRIAAVAARGVVHPG